MKQQPLLFDDIDTPPAFNKTDESKELLIKINKLEPMVFTYETSVADRKKIREAIREYIVTKSTGSFVKAMFNIVWTINNNGAGMKYTFFSEKAQRVYLDRRFVKWAGYICDLMTIELEKLNKI